MRITLYLLVDGAALDKSALRAGTAFKLIPTSPPSGIKSALFIRGTPVSEAKWAKELRGLATNPADLSPLRAMSSGAVLLVSRKARLYALTFGSGFQAIEPSKIKHGFGLRVTANAVAIDRIKGADTRVLEREGRSQKTLLPQASALSALGIEPLEEWVKQLTGAVKDSTFAKTAAGADSLRLTIENFTLAGLPKKLDEISALYDSTDYQSSFGFLDYFKQLDPKSPQVGLLDLGVEDRVKKQDADIYFAAPDPFEQLPVEHYQFVRSKTRFVEELTQAEVYAALSDLDLTVHDPLRATRVRALDESDNEIDKVHKLYDYIQAEHVDPTTGDRFILSAGRWFQVAKDYIDQVRQELTQIADVTASLALPPWQKAADGTYEDEGAYNERVRTALGFALLDKKNLYFPNYQKVEICDLLTPDRELLFVKRATKSSTLSHLFAQAQVSSSLMYLPKYQDKLMTALTEVTKSPGKFGDKTWHFIYVIATDKPAPLLDNLFFFSQLALVKQVADIRSHGHRVSVAMVQMS